MTGDIIVKELGETLSVLCRAYARHLRAGGPRIPFDELLKGLERDIFKYGWDQSLAGILQSEEAGSHSETLSMLHLSRIWRGLYEVSLLNEQLEAAEKEADADLLWIHLQSRNMFATRK